ncbi:MAG: TAT-variant-translocated molybdopterin oxidoreductase [Planctomycetota bacterium]
MSTIDQCPSTKGKLEIPAEPRELQTLNGRATGQKYWRSVEEYAGTLEFKEAVEREFPAGASELLSGDRRGFLKLMTASLALAGLATVPGCRRPDHKILAYSQDEPEHTIPGKPLYFATSMPLPGGGAEGLLVETHGNRPTKIEGNPLHPINKGKSSIFAQAEILRLYDPDRLKGVTRREQAGERSESSWEDFKATALADLAETHEADRGRGLAVICDKADGPTMRAARRSFLDRFPDATWVWWDAVDAERASLSGTELAFGRPAHVRLSMREAACVVSLGSDFMEEGPDHINVARDFAATRRVENAGDEMSRLYVAETVPSGTGSLADHRMRLSPTEMMQFTVELAKRVFARRPVGAMRAAVDAVESIAIEGVSSEMIDAIAEDLVSTAESRTGGALLVAGETLPAEGHALVAAMNQALGSVGRTVRYQVADNEMEADPFEAVRSLVANVGSLRTLVTINVNPVYDAPAELGITREVFESIPTTIALDSSMTETTEAASWSLNGAHVLESWGDTRAADGTIAPIQPMIAPLYEPAMSPVEFVALLAGNDEPDGYQLMRAAWARTLGLDENSDGFKRALKRALHDGVVPGTSRPAVTLQVDANRVGGRVRAMASGMAASEGLHVVFSTGRVGDGRYANCGWLQELPQSGTQVCWDNPLLVSPRTADELGLLPYGLSSDEGDLDGVYTKSQIPKARVATLTVPDGDGGTVTLENAAVWILPGMADNVVHATLGYGRSANLRVAGDVGFNTYQVRTTFNRGGTGGASLERVSGRRFPIVSTQNHWSMESRDSIVRAIDKKWFDKHASEGKYDHRDEIYGADRRDGGLNVAEQLGELSHTPENISLYTNPQNNSKDDPEPKFDKNGNRLPPKQQPDFVKSPQWGMTIDLSSCTGCGLCTIACQAENNIPIVGKQEVAKGREMTWIRVDRYFVGDDLNRPDEVLNQPVACVHCENAPCETVCPVNATVHGTEGTNNMAYNRCIGTRYCANNCPYKARRFNFFDWGQTEYNGDFLGEGVIKSFTGDEQIDQRSFNKNLIPPRLRQQLTEVSAMSKNPDVSVRGRGVMEKCTYCIQRINAARQEVKVRGIWDDPEQVAPIPDGFFEVACQQACPSESIVFGDITDPESKVTETRASDRSYLLLGYLNTRPRTSHMLKVRNPNEDVLRMEYDMKLAEGLVTQAQYEDRFADPIHHGGGHGDGHGDDHGGDHSDDHGDDSHGGGTDHVFRDRLKGLGDRGYAMSLKVLGNGGMT